MSHLEQLLYGTDDAGLLALPDDRRDSEATRATAIDLGLRDAARELVWLVVVCWVWVLLGVLAFFWASASNSDAAALAGIWALGLGYGGIYFTIVAYCVRRAERDDW